MINPFYFTNRVLKSGFINILDSHHISHEHSKLTNTPKYLETEKIHVIIIVKEMSNKFARLKIIINIKQCFQPDFINRMKMIQF